MYLKNPYYLEAIKEEEIKYKARIKLNDITLENSNIKNIKYDLSINDNEKFKLGGVHGATVTLNILNYDGEFNNFKFENKEFPIELRPTTDSLYTVGKVHKEKVGIINHLKIKYLTSLWVPQGKFYPTEITKNENKTITIKLIDKTKYLEDEYVCSLTPPFNLKQLYDDVHSKAQIISDTTAFYNQDQLINTIPEGYTYKQILGYIAECACGFYIINRLGNGEIRTYGTDSKKSIEKGKYKKFLPFENYITIQKLKYAGSNIIGAEKGYVLELDEKNPFITDTVAQNILLKMQGFTFIPYTYQATNSDFTVDVGDKFDITDTNDTKYLTYVMNDSWEFTGAISQNWQAKGENELNNTYSSKGPITQQIENIVKEQIPNAKQEAIDKATELLTDFNGGYVVKKAGELFISDNEDIDKARHVWRWNINGLGYSSTGIAGPYGLAMTMDGKIVADFITTGTMSAERINGGTLRLGGNNNTNGSIQVVDANGNDLVKISKDGLILNNGTKLIGNGGLLSNLQFNSGEMNLLGVTCPFYQEYSKKSLTVYVELPENFNVESAYITIIHQPVYWNDQNWGYSRNIGVYKSNNDSIANWDWNSDFGETTTDSSTQISNLFGSSNTWQPSTPNSDKHSIEIKKSNNIKDYIKAGFNKFIIQTTDSLPEWTDDNTETKYCKEHTAFAMAIIDVYGYIN